jgi:hypothetical protein
MAHFVTNRCHTPNPFSLACSRDGRHLAVAVNETVQLWDAAVLTAPPGAKPIPGLQAGADAAASPDRPPRQ